MNSDAFMSATADSAAIEALGPLFKITEVFLWDDAMVTAAEASAHLDDFAEEAITSCTFANVNSSIDHVREDYRSAEDIALAKEMDALGLPLSFRTTKQNNRVVVKGKRKGLLAKSVFADADTENRVASTSINCLLEDDSSSRILQDSTNIPLCSMTIEDGTKASFHDSYEDRSRNVFQSDRESSGATVAILSHTGETQDDNKYSDVTMINCAEDELSTTNLNAKMSAEGLDHAQSLYPENFLRDDNDGIKNGAHHKAVLDKHVENSYATYCITGEHEDVDGMERVDSYPTSMESSLSCVTADHDAVYYSDNCSELGDWRVIWDAFYKRNYFYNTQSQESTWYPPPGLEHFALCSTLSNSNGLTDVAEEHTGIEFACDAMHDLDLHGLLDRASSSQEKEVAYENLNDASSVVISTRVNDDFTEDFGGSKSDEQAIFTKNGDESVSLLMPIDYSTDELDINEHGRKQEKHISSEACSVSDLPHGLTNNSLNGTEDGCNSPNPSLISSMDDVCPYHESGRKKKKKRVRRLQSQYKLEGIDGDLPSSVVKYWCQRYSLFAQFDNGIKMDEEGWFSVTPESIARHHASRCGTGVIIDCFTGAGGNAIQFAMKSSHVIAIDIDPQKIDYAQHNASIYGVTERIDFIKGDFFKIAPHLKGNVIFMSPPWGGPDYTKVQSYDIRTMLKPHDGQYLFKVARAISSRVVMFLPRNVDLNQLAELSFSANPPWALEVEKNFLNGRLKAITAYFDNPNSNNVEGIQKAL